MVKGLLYLGISLVILITAYLNTHSYHRKTEATLRYMPLGDSYTIGTGAEETEAWPYILCKHLNEQNISCKLIDNPARNGFSTQDLIDEELPLVRKLKPNFVTLMIGVNDWVRGINKEEFKRNFQFILNELEREINDKEKIVLITIPDFGVSPAGKQYARGRNISEGILEFNNVIAEEAKARNLLQVDIYEISKMMENDASLVAADGLHPSAKEYAIWEKLIFKKVKLVLN